MKEKAEIAYPPINVMKQMADDLWVVDGPVIRFGTPLLKMPFPTRMTVIRLAGRNLFIHSPTPLTTALKNAVDVSGSVRWIVGPNRLHYVSIPQWRSTFPEAQVYLAPRIREQAKGRIDFPAAPLLGERGYPWDADIATLPVPGSYMTEFEFFHFKSRTLVLTDLIENFEAHKLAPGPMRWLARLGGVLDPNGGTPRDMRFTFHGRRAELRAAVGRMMSLNPERIIIAHGRCYERNCLAELRRAFGWVLAPS